MKWQVIVLLVLLIACAKPATQEAAHSDAEEHTEEVAHVEESKPMAETETIDIASAMKLGKSVKCVSSQEGQTATIYMKGSQMRMDTMPADAHGIYTADTMYTWKDKQGMMMKMEDVKRMAEEAGHPARPKTQEEIIASQANVKCESASVDESMFTPPSDVQFQDMGEMLKQAEAAMKGLPK
jgi:hypothetical protein